MKKFSLFSDKRLLGQCVFCGNHSPTTRDHIPSRVLLDTPYPADYPVVDACHACNVSFSLDEEYFACLLECVTVGGVEKVVRPKIQKIFSNQPNLLKSLSKAFAVKEGTIQHNADLERVKNVVLKTARGISAFELSEIRIEAPQAISIVPFPLLNKEERMQFEQGSEGCYALYPELGSRGMQRIFAGEFTDGWVIVQSNRFRFRADSFGEIRMVFSEYLACSVAWGT